MIRNTAMPRILAGIIIESGKRSTSTSASFYFTFGSRRRKLKSRRARKHDIKVVFIPLEIVSSHTRGSSQWTSNAKWDTVSREGGGTIWIYSPSSCLPHTPEWSPVVHSPIANAGRRKLHEWSTFRWFPFSEDAIACWKYLPDSIKCLTSDSINVPALYDLVLARSLRLSRESMEEDITDGRMIMRGKYRSQSSTCYRKCDMRWWITPAHYIVVKCPFQRQSYLIRKIR